MKIMSLSMRLKNQNRFLIWLIGTILISSITYTTSTMTLKERIVDLLLVPLSSATVSTEIKAKATTIAQRLVPASLPTLRNLTFLGRLLIGHKNTMSIPFINYVLINEQWLDSLPPKAQEFILARSMIYLFSVPYEYTLYKYIFPILLYNFCQLSNDHLQEYSDHIFQWKKQLIYYFLIALSSLIKPYYLRKLEYKIDAKAATYFDCFEGSFFALLDSIKFSNQGSLLERLNSKISGIEAVDLALNIGTLYARFYPFEWHTISLEKLLLISAKLGKLTFPLSLLFSPHFLLPGRFNDRQSTFFNFVKNLPLINLLFEYPKPYKRIRALTDLRNKFLKNKLLKEKDKAKQMSLHS